MGCAAILAAVTLFGDFFVPTPFDIAADVVGFVIVGIYLNRVFKK